MVNALTKNHQPSPLNPDPSKEYANEINVNLHL